MDNNKISLELFAANQALLISLIMVLLKRGLLTKDELVKEIETSRNAIDGPVYSATMDTVIAMLGGKSTPEVMRSLFTVIDGGESK